MNARYILFTKTKSLWNGKPHNMILMSVLMLLGNFPRDEAFPFFEATKCTNIYSCATRICWIDRNGHLAYLLIDIYCLWYICQPNYKIWNAPVRKENLIYQIPLFWTLKLFFWWIHMSQMKVIVIIHLLTCIG